MALLDLEQLLLKRGWIDAEDCRRHGVTSAVVCTRVRRGEWLRIRRGLYVAAQASPQTRTEALVLSRPGTVLGGSTAAWWHGLTSTAGGPLTLLTARDQRLRSTGSVTPSRPQHLCESCTTAVRGVPVVRLERAALEHARCLPLWADAEAFVTGVVQRGRTTGRRLTGMSQHLRIRSQPVAELLDHICRGSRSLPEIDFIRLVRRFQLPEPQRNVPILCADGVTRYADLAYPEQGYYIEIDGRMCHFALDDWEADLSRMNEISISCPLKPLRFSSRQLRREQEQVAAQLDRALRGAISRESA
ncbi:MAG TPA: hypothetical protein VNA12_03265 [Mycobacteriales bacterium]|nr:hypothetical protein [Mycobacteriales bacterium]